MKAEPVDFWRRLKEISRFFEGRDQVHRTMYRLVSRLERAGIPYAVVGGMAVHAHGLHQTTADVDVLLTPAGLAEFRRRFVPARYRPRPDRTRRFVDRANEVGVGVLVTGRYPRNGRPGPIAFPDPATVREMIRGTYVVRLVTLVELKLASRRYRDLGDVAGLIRCLSLDETFAGLLHPSVRDTYTVCLEEKRREDEYEARYG